MLDARSNTPIFGFVRPKKVNNMLFTSRPFFVIPLALLFLFNALGGDMLVGEVWAARSSSGLTSVGLDSTGSPSPLKNLSASTFTLPQELGIIQESAELPNSVKTVIHIQDAHCNYAAQKSIAEILNYLTTEYGIYAVNCEGAAESYDLSPFTAIPEKDIREKTADFFVKEGIVSASEYYAVNNPRKVSLWGVEDPDLYLKNLKVYRDSLAHKDEVDRYIKSIGYILDNLKRHIYSDELLELDKHYTGYKENKITFKEYLLYLISMARKRMIDIKSFSNIYLLSQTLTEEDKIDFKRANNEKDEVVDKLKKSLSRNELEDLLTMAGKLKTERISQADFYAYLVKRAKSVNLDISGYSELQKYIIYISLYSAIDRTKVTKEIDALEHRIKTSLYENDTQRELGILSKNLAITKNMFNISLTRDDYIYYKEHRETFAVANYVSFIDKKAPLYKIGAALDKNIGSLDEYRELMDQFYECSLERDKAFIKNIKFTDHDRPSSIIITGGFHTENLRELFKNENVSYVSIMPKFNNEKGYESPYMKRLAGQRTALENVIDTVIPAVLNLQVVEILSTQLALKVEGEARLATFKLAVLIFATMERMKQPFAMKLSKGLIINNRRLDEDKVIIFTRGEGGNISYEIKNLSKFEGGINGVNIGLVSFEPLKYELNPLQHAQLTETPVAQQPLEAITPKEKEVVMAGPISGSMYEAAKAIAPEIASALRRESPTYLISPAVSEEDISPTTSNNRTAEQILGKQGHEIHAKSYLVKGDWVKNLKELLENNLLDFAKNADANLRTRMAIRIMADEKGNVPVEGIKAFIKEFLKSKLPRKENEDDKKLEQRVDKIIKDQVRFVPISIQNVKHFNSSIDLFTDISMMEIDRYINGNYPSEELPPQLRDRFVALLKLSIVNFDDLMKLVKTEQDIEGILNAIFKANILLQIRPIDWKSMNEWRKAQDAVLQSV